MGTSFRSGLLQPPVAASKGAATLTLRCDDLPTQTYLLQPGLDKATPIVTGWQDPCEIATFETTNGWETAFDDIELSPFP